MVDKIQKMPKELPLLPIRKLLAAVFSRSMLCISRSKLPRLRRSLACTGVTCAGAQLPQ
jgi:hypothetical protein